MPPISADEDFSTLFAFLPIGAYRSSPGGRQVRANPALVALNGYHSEEEQLANVSDIASEWYVDPQRRAQFMQLLERDGSVKGFVSEVWRHRTRERIWVSENAHVVRAADGSVSYYEGTVEEITERVAAERALRASEERWKLALESTGDGVWDWDLQTGIETISPGFEALYGYTAEELGRWRETFDELTHPDDVAQMQRDRQAHFDGSVPRYVNEHRVRCKDGSWKWVLSRGLAIHRDADGRPVRMIGTHTDITAIKQAEALRQERDRAETADRAKTELLSRVSHELRTPLNAVLGFAQLLDQATTLGERHQAWLTQILASGRHLLELVDDVLDMSSAQSGEMSLAWAEFDPLEVAADSWAMLAAQAAKTGVQLTLDAAREPSLQVRADRRRLTQVMSNLLSNAIKYNHPGGSVAVRAVRQAQEVQITVADSGQGMSAAQLARIFKPFERLGAQHSAVQGSGLGLALTRQLVLAMQGRIEVASDPGLGSTFTVTLQAAGAAPP
jgi:PAS domain S-box-containing protein